MENIYEYAVIATVKHFNKKFLVLFNKIHGIYFLQKSENGFEYPTLDQFMELKRIYNPLRTKSYYEKMNVKPLVKIKNKLISTLLVSTILLTMTGCSNEETLKGLTNCGITLSDGLIEDDNIYFVTGMDFENPKIERVIGAVDSELKYSYNELVSINEFAERLGVQNKTYEDVLDVLKKNPNIDDKIKSILEEGINNLKASNFDINLGLLYYNLRDLKVEYTDNLLIDGALGIFNENNRVVSIRENVEFLDNEDEYKHLIIHEIIGHGLTSAYSEDLKILCGPEVLVVTTDENEKIVSTISFGNAFKEGLTELITARALNEKIDCSNFYSTESYMVQFLSELYEIPLSEIAEGGIQKLVLTLKENGTYDGFILLEALDVGMRAKMEGTLDVDYVTTNNVCAVLCDYIRTQYMNGKSKEEILNKIDSVFNNMENIFKYEELEQGGKIIYSTGFNCYTYVDVDYVNNNAIYYCDQLYDTKLKLKKDYALNKNLI